MQSTWLGILVLKIFLVLLLTIYDDPSKLHCDFIWNIYMVQHYFSLCNFVFIFIILNSNCRYPESFLVRIYGAYNLVVYGTHFRFFVMENLFYVRPPKTSLSIYERYNSVGCRRHALLACIFQTLDSVLSSWFMVEVCVKQSMNMPCACTGTGSTSRVRGCRGTFRLQPLASKRFAGSVGKNMWSARRRTSARRMCKACTLLMWYWRTVTCRPSFRLSQTKHIGSAYSWNAIRNFWCSGTSWTTLFWLG